MRIRTGNNRAKTSARRQAIREWLKQPDNCEICFGTSGGVRGNENVIDGKTVCDYCSVEFC